MKTLQNLFLGELADILDAEHRLVKALPKMARAATCTHLQEALLDHLEETQGHVKKLGKVFESFGHKARGKTCQITVGLVAEAEGIAEEYAGSPAINAALIAAAQKVEHHEIASYGCLLEWAERLGNKEAADLLQEILNEEKAANNALTELALTRSNDEALEGGGAAEDAENKSSEGLTTGAQAVH